MSAIPKKIVPTKSLFLTDIQAFPINSALIPAQNKRTFSLNFSDFEEAPSKALKSTKTQRILRFQGNSTGQKEFTEADLQKCISSAISAAIQPLISEIQTLKTEISSLKTVKTAQNTPQPSNSQEKITVKSVKKAAVPQSLKNSIHAKNDQKTAQKTWAEISKLNHLVAVQTTKMDKQWTVIRKRANLKRELAPKKNLELVDRRILF